MVKRTLLLLWLLLVLLLSTSAQAIIGGEPDGNRHPYAGAVFDLAGDGSLGIGCSGVLVSPRVFLTAGHCTEGFLSPPPDLSVSVSFASDATGLVGQVTGTPHTSRASAPAARADGAAISAIWG